MNNQDILHLLVSEWSGTGRGEFPTIEPFEYLETIHFSLLWIIRFRCKIR